MSEKCVLCSEKIDTTFLEKLNGTVLKIKKNNGNEKVYICSSCQKKYGRGLKNKIESKLE